MKPRILIGSLLVLCLFLSPAVSQVQPKKAVFDGQAAWTYIRDMATDAMQGRRSGTPGGRMGAEYIAAKFKEWGLEPAGDKGGYFQDFTVDLTNVEPGVALEIRAGKSKREFIYGEDWRQARFSGSANTLADVVWVGYGISAPQKEYDDYAGVDVKGKFVLFATATPQRFGEKLKDEAEFDNRIKAAQAHGAIGALVFQPAQTAGMMAGVLAGPVPGGFVSLKKENFKNDFPIASLEPKIVDYIFKDLRTDLRYLQQQVEMTGKPQPFDIGTRAYLKINIAYDDKRHTENVLAKITGSDPKLKNEYVIIGGHMDGTGMDAFGEPKNAANDNASGTAVAMEVARIMKTNRIKPKRTVIFAGWAAEEMGLLGSKYYTENPTHPIERTVTYINMDMVSHGDGKLNFPGIYYGPEIWDLLKSKLPKEILDKAIPSRGGPGGSDHSHFLYKGVPAFAIMTSGYHFKYHQTGDDIEFAKPEILKTVGDFVTACVDILANEPKNLIQPQRQEAYWFKYLTLLNFKTPVIDKIVEEHKDIQDPIVDTQLAVIPEKEGLTGDALKADTLRNLWALPDKVKDSKTFLLSGAAGAAAMMGAGRGPAPSKSTLIPGLGNINAFRDDPRWADIFAKQGAQFAVVGDPGFMFSGSGLSEEGKKVIDGLNKATLLLIVKGLNDAQAKALLEAYKKPFVMVAKTLPDKAVIDFVKKSGSLVGLVFGKDEDGAAYFKRLDEAKKALGPGSLAIVNENCLWDQAAKDQYYKLLGEMFKAKYENADLTQLFSGSFMSVLNRVKTDSSAQARVTVMMF